MFYAHFHSGVVPIGQLQIIAIDSRRCREALGSHEVKLGNSGDIGTGTKSGGIGTHIHLRCSGVLVPVPYQGGTGITLTGTSTEVRYLQDLRGISILVQGHAHLLIPTSRSLMWMVFKPT